MKPLYKGFSTHEFVKKRTFKVTDVELVKLDLLSFIYTTKGTRLKMPWFGTTIPLMVFQPFDSDTIDEIKSELRRAVDYDPRLRYISTNFNADYDGHSILVELRVFYVELNMETVLYLNIDTAGTT